MRLKVVRALGITVFTDTAAAGAGAESGAGFNSSGYGAFADEDPGPAEEHDGRRRQILDAALKHVVRARRAGRWAVHPPTHEIWGEHG